MESRLKAWKFPEGNLTLRGYSRAAEATYFFVPELKIALDMGGIDKTIHSQFHFITHSHMDHCIHLPEAQPAFVSIKDPAQIYVPQEAMHFAKNYMHAAQELNSVQQKDRIDNLKEKPFEMHAVKPGDVYTLNDRYQVDVIKCHHSVPTVGYAFSELRNKLKPEYKNKSQNELAELRKNKIQIQDRVKVERFVFLGDTTPEVFKTHPEILAYPVLIIECTFIADDHVTQAIQSDHVHWSQIQEIVLSNPKVTFILIHFSLRYKTPDIEKLFDQLSGGRPKNVVLWI